MIVRQFLLWARTAPSGHRAEAVGALARAFLYSDLSPEDRSEAETALTAMLDDPSPLVRRAMAEAFANATEAPRHLIIALASDQNEIATLILSRSQVLTDADLIDAAALGDEAVQTAIALRLRVSTAVSAALAEIAVPHALVSLVRNGGAEIAATSFARLLERHGSHATLREALLARPNLPVDSRQALAVLVAGSIAAFVRRCGWLSADRIERVSREAREKTTIVLSSKAESECVGRLVIHLRRTGQLTPALVLRAMLSRGFDFVEAAFADLSGLPVARVSNVLNDRRGQSFAPLYRRAGLPESLLPAFEAALSALHDEPDCGQMGQEGANLSRRMIERVLTSCENLPSDESAKLIGLLRRYEVEAARDEARDVAGVLADDAALTAVLTHMPHLIGRLPEHEGRYRRDAA